jgi:antirestriction protein
MIDTKLPLLTAEWYAQKREERLLDEIAESYDLIAVQMYADNLHLEIKDFEDWKEQFEDSFQGRWETFKDYADQLADDLGESAGTRYFDYDGFARDLEFDYWYEVDRTEWDTLVFRNY